MRRYLSTLLLGAAMCTPVVMHAQDHHSRRYYDRSRKDYHEWNEQEERAYRHWLTEVRHRRYHSWARSRAAEQREYWRWRHDHADWRM